MTYQEFLNIIFNSTNKFINYLSNILNPLMENYFFKTILYVVLIILILEFINLLLKYITKLFSNKIDSKNSNNIE